MTVQCRLVCHRWASHMLSLGHTFRIEQRKNTGQAESMLVGLCCSATESPLFLYVQLINVKCGSGQKETDTEN